jgi:hypothetical protein
VCASYKSVETVNHSVNILLFTFCLLTVTFPVLTAPASNAIVEATVFVHPDTLTVAVNATFQIFINVSSASGLQGFDFMLAYNSTLLNCSDVAEGTFLSGSGSTFVAKQDVNNSFSNGRGRVWFAVVIYGTGFADGNGTLAVLSFKALSIGQTVLDLFSDNPFRGNAVKLTTCQGQVIPNEAVDGSVVVAEESGDPPDPPPNVNQNLQTRLARADLNGDGIIDMKDLAIVAAAYGTIKGGVRFNAKADLDQNGQVDILDFALIAPYFMFKTQA